MRDSLPSLLVPCCRGVAAVLSVVLLFNPLARAAALPAGLSADQTSAPPAPPIPSQIVSAHNVFVSNNGADANFPVNAEESYNDIYAARKA